MDWTNAPVGTYIKGIERQLIFATMGPTHREWAVEEGEMS